MKKTTCQDRKSPYLIIPLLLIALGVFLSSPSVAKEQNKSELIYELDFDKADLYFQMSEGYDVVGMKGCIFTRDVGKPQLPLKVVHYAIPTGMDVSKIEILDCTVDEILGEYNVFPAPKSQIISEEYEFTPPDEATYASQKPYPGDIIGIPVSGSLSGADIATLSLYPVQYIPAEKKLIFYTNIKFKLICTPSTSAKKEKTARPKIKSNKAKKSLESFLDKVIANPDKASVLQGIMGQSQTFGMPGEPIIEGEKLQEQILPEGQMASMPAIVDYVIITNEALIPSFEVLAQSKQQRGLSTFIETVANIESAYPGRDVPEKIRNFIKDLYENHGLMWVLLGGDTNIVPYRIEHCGGGPTGPPTPNPGSAAPCDMYYSDLDGDWDGNGDGLFGQFDDGVDLYPDVFVGRASVENEVEANTFVNKVLTYETLEDAYLNEALFIGGASFEDCGGRAKDLIADNYMPEIFNITKLYGRDGTETRDNVIRELNRGCYIVNHIDHAHPDYLGLGGWQLTISDVESLTNGPRFSILWSCGCTPAAIDYDCFAEHWITAPNGGGIAFIGNTRYGPHPESDGMLDPSFFNSLFVEGIYNLGLTLAHSKLPYIALANTSTNMRYALFELCLIGDPELSVRFTSSDATVRFTGEAFPIPSQAGIALVDKDLNLNPEICETIDVYVTSLTETIPESVTLTESGPNSSIFMGEITLQAGEPLNDGIPQVSMADTITVTYEEASPSGIKSDTALVDGVPPIILENSLNFDEHITMDGVAGCLISFDTDEPTKAIVTCRKESNPPTAFLTAESAVFSTHTSIDISKLELGKNYYCEITAVDRAGNKTVRTGQFIIISSEISVAPASFSFTIPEGDTREGALLISNDTIESADLRVKFSCSGYIELYYNGTKINASTEVEIPSGQSAVINVKVNGSYLTPGQYSYPITVSTNDMTSRTVSVSISVTVIESQNVRTYYRCVIDDWSSRSFSCDGDQNFDPGERDELSITLKNFGTLSASGVTSTLIYNGDPAYISVLDDTSSYGDIPSHATVFPVLDGTQADDFLIEISPVCPEGYAAPFTLMIEDAGHHTLQEEFSLVVTRDSLAVCPELEVGNRNGNAYPKISSNEQGWVYVVWCKGGNSIYFNHSTDYGKTWHAETRLDNGSGSAANPQISSDGQGRVYAVWCENGNSIYFNHSIDSGATWQGETRLDNGSVNAHKGHDPQISSGGQGRIYVAWSVYHDIVFNYSIDGGRTWHDEAILGSNPSSASGPRISSDGQGRVYITWYVVNGWGRAYFNHSTDGGETWHGDVQVSNDFPSAAGSPSISSDESGNVYLAWGAWDSLHFNHAINYGDIWQGEIRLDNGSGNAYNPQISSDEQGGVYLVWCDDTNCINFDYSTNEGRTFRGKSRLDNGIGGVSNPQITADKYGNAYVVWEDSLWQTIDSCFISAAAFPALSPISDQIVGEGALLEFNVNVTNPEGKPAELFFDVRGIEDGALRSKIEADAQLMNNGDRTGIFNWTPDGFSQGIYYPVVFVARDGSGRCDFQPITITVEDTLDGVLPGGSIQEAIDNTAKSGVYISSGTYEEGIYIKNKDLHLIGNSASSTAIKGNISLCNSDSSVENLSILYKQGNAITYSDEYYTGFKLESNSGITAINSAITVKDCIIKPDPDIFGETKFGNGIQIWNLYGTTDISPIIDNCQISNADTGIYLYSQASGGAILGEIRNNTLNNNNYGIILRMHKEKPLIQNNEITNSINAIHITYEDGALLQARLNNIINNTFSGNTDNIWCDELQSQP